MIRDDFESLQADGAALINSMRGDEVAGIADGAALTNLMRGNYVAEIASQKVNAQTVSKELEVNFDSLQKYGKEDEVMERYWKAGAETNRTWNVAGDQIRCLNANVSVALHQ